MASFRYGIGKGLREPCSPYREAYYFGAELNKPSADGWNCLPELVSETHSFDLSAIPKGREVVVALLNIRDIPLGKLNFKAEWYRNRDNALLFTYTGSLEIKWGYWAYFYVYLGYVDWEINENGGYRVEFTVTGVLSFHHVLQFTISGIPIEKEVEPIPTGAMGWISERFSNASGFFYQLYLEALDWWVPFDKVAGFFYALAQTCSDLSWDFYDFSVWVELITGRILRILSWDTIWSYILSYVPNLFEIRDWFYYWLDYVTQAIDNWWLAAQSTVRGWIDATENWAQSWITYLLGQVDELRVRLDNLVIGIPNIPELLAWLSGLIDSAFLIRSSFWEGWQELRTQVTEFISDPSQWFYDRLDEIFERYW